MAYNFNYITLVLSLCMLLTACSDQDVSVVEPNIPEIEKTPIELTVGGVESNSGVMTRAAEDPSSTAVITDNISDKMLSFPYATNIFMVMQSEYGQQDFDDPDNPHKLKTTVTRGTVSASNNSVSFDNFNQRYWDDAHARSSQLSIWAYAQMYKTSWTSCTFQKIVDNTKPGWEKFADDVYFTSGGSQSYGWNRDEVYPGIKYWSASHNDGGKQDAVSVVCQDLLFSNNIADNKSYPVDAESDKKVGDHRLKFNFETRKFPVTSQMYFRHAMSKITIKLRKAVSFTDGEFNLTTKTEGVSPVSTNVILKDFNTQGAFNIKEGEFQWIWKHDDIPGIYQWESPAADDTYTLEALVIPNIQAFLHAKGYDVLSEGAINDIYSRFTKIGVNTMLTFSIGDNKYEISSKQLYNALHVAGNPNNALVANATTVGTGDDAYIPLEAGKHYIFTFTVGKTKIEHLTAELADWETVASSQITPSNAHVDIDLEERGVQLSTTDVLDLYRVTRTSSGIAATDFIDYEWKTGYDKENKNTYSYVDGAWKLASYWYWPDNKTYYHLRGILPGGTEVKTEATNGDYVELASGNVSGDGAYKDVRWGAPMRDDKTDEEAGTFKWKYDFANGFGLNNISLGNKNQIHEAIGATEGKLKFTLFHMMSEIKVTLTATGSNVPTLSKPENDVTTYATVELLNFKDGKLLLGNGSVQTTEGTKNQLLPKADATYVYQYGVVPQALSDDVKLRIKTADDNVYYVDLNKVVTDAGHIGIGNSNLDNPYTVTAGNCTIDKWYPGFKYEYTINLTLKGIDKVGVKLVDWKDVKMDEEGIQIK